MGCFFACFRLKEPDRKRQAYPVTPPSASKERLVSKHQLASVLLCEEGDSPCENNSGQGSFDRELKNEARIFKACGAVLETPDEFQKASLKIISENKENELSFKPQMCKILQWDESTDQTIASPSVLRDEADFLVCKPGSSTPNEMLAKRKGKNSLASLIDETESADSENEIMSTESKSQNNDPGTVSAFNVTTPQIASQTREYVLKPSVYPTPLKLTDEMQTPGTVYPTNFDKIGAVKNARIRSQYVYPVLKPVANVSELKTLKENSQTRLSDDNKQTCNNITPMQHSNLSYLVGIQSSQGGHDVPTEEIYLCPSPGDSIATENLDAAPSCTRDHKHQNDHDSSAVSLSLSQWLKPPISEEERRRNWEAAAKEKSPSGKSSGEDRPIIGLVATHWNGDESSRISPKWRDGNGIPNSTNKYKEDQRVSWHATPFEERLEKALSDEKLFPERKVHAMPVKFCDEDE